MDVTDGFGQSLLEFTIFVRHRLGLRFEVFVEGLKLGVDLRSVARGGCRLLLASMFARTLGHLQRLRRICERVNRRLALVMETSQQPTFILGDVSDLQLLFP